MKNSILILFLFVIFSVQSQETSNLRKGKKHEKISFKFINNLIIVPLKINGIEGDFILDTGVRGNILFLGETNRFSLNDSVKTVNLRGFGYGAPVKAYVSIANTIRHKNIVLKNKDFFLLKDEKLNFSAKTGIAIHGLIGSDFFKNNVIRVNYKHKHITVYDTEYFYRKQFNPDKVEDVDLVFHNQKPYMEGEVKINENDTSHIPVKLLIDTGGTEALWLFKDENKFEKLPPKFFSDLLGESLTGTIHGDKSRIENFAFGGYDFGNPIVTFLDDEVASKAKKIKGRSGTLGAGILKRFTVWFDYKNKKMYLRKNSDYKDEFYYNMSGLEINYNGNIMVLEFRQPGASFSNSQNTVSLDYHFALKPTYVIANVRKGSPGDLGGLKSGDVLLEIDHIPVHKKTFGDIIDHFYKKKNKKVDVLVRRADKEIHFNFHLIDELD